MVNFGTKSIIGTSGLVSGFLLQENKISNVEALTNKEYLSNRNNIERQKIKYLGTSTVIYNNFTHQDFHQE